MKNKEKSTKQILLEHSEVKVALLGRYLSIYLQIMHRVDFIKRIFVFDLFAGEGKYLDGREGSPLVIIRKILNYYRQYGDGKEINLFLNDSGQSDIDIDKKKIDRIRFLISKIKFPSNFHVKTSEIDYKDIIPSVSKRLSELNNSERALLFLDPWGYKDIKPKELKELLNNGKTEILLFLPVSFMYRFALKCLQEEFPGSRALEEFLTVLFSDKFPDTSSPEKFILSLKTQMRDYLNVPFVDTFSLQRDKSNIYCLFFYTNNKKGFQKMIEAKWNIDKEGGKGFYLTNNLSLFSEVEAINYTEMLLEKIINSGGVTNEFLADYGYNIGFLPKHTKEILAKLKKEDKIEVESMDGKDVKSFYIGNESRKVLIRRKNGTNSN